MFGRKSNAEKEKEMEKKIEAEIENRKSKEEAEKKLEELKAKFKIGATFKLLELNIMLRGLHVSCYWGGKYHVAVDAICVKDGEVLPVDINVELLENLEKL